jgi:hypothetical protein
MEQDRTDGEALESFCRDQYPRLVRLLGLYSGDLSVGEDLAQETLARVWASELGPRRQARPPSPVGSSGRPQPRRIGMAPPPHREPQATRGTCRSGCATGAR